MVLLSITRLFILSINNANEMRYKILTLGYLDSYRNKDGKDREREERMRSKGDKERERDEER